jgi:N-acetylneuraminic acid mutarotase/glucose/arabinose dehydrogenase
MNAIRLLARTAVLAVLFAPQIGAQVVAYGSGCPGQAPAPSIAYLGSTVPGENAAVRVEGAPPGGFVYLHIGISDSTSIFGPLPFDISIFAGVNPGCSLLVSPDIRLLLNAKPDGTLQMGFKVPAAFSSDMYFQWAVFESLAPVSVTMTPAVHVSVTTNPFLHAVILADDVVVDHDGNGSEPVLLDGSDSHTHELGHALTDWTWKENGLPLAATEVATVPLALGEHEITLLIGDDNVPQDTLMDVATVEVVPATAVPGVAARYYGSGLSDPTTLLDAVPGTADWAEVLPDLTVLDGGGIVGNSPFTGQVMVQLLATVELPDNDSYLFSATGGSDRRLFVDGSPVLAASFLPAGTHLVEARFSVPDTTSLPLLVTLAQGGGPPTLVPGDDLTHDQTGTPPVINAITPDAGTTAGGNAIVIDGVGFFPASAVTVHWGDVDLTQASGLQITAEQITFSSPPHGPGMLNVTVQAPSGTSNTQIFTYSGAGPVPINFQTAITFGMASPTAGDWGPDGRLYVTSLTGELKAVSFDQDWNVLGVDTYAGVSGLLNSQSVGLAFNPLDPPGPVRVYVSHMLTYADGGGAVVNPSAYLGAVSMLEGPNFDTPVTVVSGLPQSNSGHNTNGITFDNNGDLLICQGSNTNAGVKDIGLGDLPESPLSAAMLKAETSRPDFDGEVHYREVLGGLPNDDQRFGDMVEVIPGTHVSVHAPGLRNPYDLVYTTAQLLYATDNGTNLTYGPASTGPTTQIPDPEEPDELLLVELGNYYGSANRNRGKLDAREYIWRGPAEPDLPDEFTQTLVTLPSSQDGITEYRATTFGGQMLGELIVQKWNGGASRIQLSPDGRTVTGVLPVLPVTGALDILTGPGGALVALNQFDSQISVLEPVDSSALPMEAQDVHPWRGPDTGGTPFVIGGHGFGDMGDTFVTFGGLPATLVSVSPRRIAGFTPPNPSAGTKFVDIVVASNALQSTLPEAFRYLFTPAGNEPGFWKGGDSSGGGELPFTAGGTSTGVIDGELYVVSESDPSTLVFHILEANEPGADWHAHTPRPFPGSAHAAEVVDDKLFLIGGLGAGSEGRVQIYDPDDDTWSLGAPMLWPGGGVGTATIGGLIYAAGGVAGGGTVDDLAVYDPAGDSWTPLPSVPAGQGRNGAAAGTDGQRLYLFGGRGNGSGGAGGLAVGFDSVQIYDPATFSWVTSLDPGSPLAPLPVPRGDLGRAVFWQGEFYVMGGETASGIGAVNGVYDRVDVYDPVANSWRLEAPMPTPRHGIDPALFQGRVFVVGGDAAAGSAPSDAIEVFTRQ